MFHLQKLKFMSNSENSINHTIRFIFSEDYKYFVDVTVYDFNSRVVKSQSSSNTEILFSIPRGIYTLRIEMNGVIKDKVTLIDRNKHYLIGDRNSENVENAELLVAPRQYSSALLGDSYASSREYYTIPSVNASSRETINLQSENNLSNSSLFIFLRFPSIDIYNQLKDLSERPFYADFEILDKWGSILINFETSNGIEVDEHFGSVAVNVALDDGVYYLIYKGKEARQIPIYVYKNWHTQFFMTLGSAPLFGTIRVFLSKERSFAFQEKAHKYVDILLDKLQNQDFTIDGELLLEVASGKFDSPMLEIICCYIYLQSKEHKNDAHLQLILQNLQNSIFSEFPDCPDLLALNILASNHFSTFDSKNATISGTPMFRVGYETILNASVTDKNLIPQNSINDFISENLYFDSPYNTFKPVPFIKKTPLKNTFKVIDIFKNQIRPSSMHSFDKEMYSPVSLGLEPKINILTFALNNLYPAELFRHIESSNESEESTSWIKNSIAEIIKIDKGLSILDISTELNISPNTVLRIFSEWEEEHKKTI